MTLTASGSSVPNFSIRFDRAKRFVAQRLLVELAWGRLGSGRPPGGVFTARVALCRPLAPRLEDLRAALAGTCGASGAAVTAGGRDDTDGGAHTCSSVTGDLATANVPEL